MSSLCNKMEQFGKGIGNASRYRILEALMKGPQTVNQIVKKVKMSQPAVSQHLKTLKGCNIVEDERKGQEVVYTLNARHILELLKALSGDVNRQKINK